MHRRLRTAALKVQRLFNDFDSLVKKPLDFPIVNDMPPIFLVSAPRTGSSLLYQVMLGQLRLAYISNIMAACPSLMIKFCKLVRRVASGYDGKIRESQYGHIPGLLSPNEAWKITHQWFTETSSDEEREYVRRTFQLISALTGCPVLMKNPMNTSGIGRILEILPASRFVFLQRDPLMTAQSILLARRNYIGRENQWLSVEPLGYKSILDRDPIYQVVWQVLTIERFVLDTFKEEPYRLVRIAYEAFCEHPRAALQAVKEALRVDWRKDAPSLDPMPASRKVHLRRDEWQRLEGVYRELTDEFAIRDR